MTCEYIPPIGLVRVIIVAAVSISVGCGKKGEPAIRRYSEAVDVVKPALEKRLMSRKSVEPLCEKDVALLAWKRLNKSGVPVHAFSVWYQPGAREIFVSVKNKGEFVDFCIINLEDGHSEVHHAPLDKGKLIAISPR